MTNHALTAKYCITLRTVSQVTNLLGLKKGKHYKHVPACSIQPCYEFTDKAVDIFEKYFNQPRNRDRWMRRMVLTHMPLFDIEREHRISRQELMDYISSHFDILSNEDVYVFYGIGDYKESITPRKGNPDAIINAKEDVNRALRNIGLIK